MFEFILITCVGYFFSILLQSSSSTLVSMLASFQLDICFRFKTGHPSVQQPLHFLRDLFTTEISNNIHLAILILKKTSK